MAVARCVCVCVCVHVKVGKYPDFHTALMASGLRVHSQRA
jgi:hypothetical protein